MYKKRRITSKGKKARRRRRQIFRFFPLLEKTKKKPCLVPRYRRLTFVESYLVPRYCTDSDVFLADSVDFADSLGFFAE